MIINVKWKWICQSVVIAGLSSCGVTLAGAATFCNSVATSSSCLPGTKDVLEVPIGVVDGHNGTFTLSAGPLPGNPVRVFDNGVEEDVHEYQVKGRSLTFVPTSIPQPGDVIDVFYAKQVPSISQPGAATVASQASDEITRQLVHQEVKKEIAQVLQVDGTAPSASIQLSPSAQRGSRLPAITMARHSEGNDPIQMIEEPRSISMLAQLLRSTQSTSRPGDGEITRKHMRDVSVDGVEGLGDSDVSNPFDYLTPSQNSELDELLGKPEANERSVETERRPSKFSSMRMLANRLNRH